MGCFLIIIDFNIMCVVLYKLIDFGDRICYNTTNKINMTRRAGSTPSINKVGDTGLRCRLCKQYTNTITFKYIVPDA